MIPNDPKQHAWRPIVALGEPLHLIADANLPEPPGLMSGTAIGPLVLALRPFVRPGICELTLRAQFGQVMRQQAIRP